jgi:hypothetical protein
MFKKLALGLGSVVAGLGLVGFLFLRAPAPPGVQPTPSQPPAIEADAATATYATSRVLDGTPRDVRQWLERIQLVTLLPKTPDIPSIRSTTVVSGSWPSEGAVRIVNLDDGHFVQERITSYNTPEVFRYQVWGFTNQAGNLVSYAVGELRYAAEGEGKTRLTWTYAMRPRYFFTRPFLNSFLANKFGPFMEGGMDAVLKAYPKQR